jgi:hypothetical protein
MLHRAGQGVVTLFLIGFACGAIIGSALIYVALWVYLNL